MNWKTHYRKDISWSQHDLQIQHNSYKNLSKIFLADIDNPILKFIWNDEETRIANTTLKKKN